MSTAKTWVQVKLVLPIVLVQPYMPLGSSISLSPTSLWKVASPGLRC